MKSSRADFILSLLARWRRTVVGGQGQAVRTDVPRRETPGSTPITARRHASSLIWAASARSDLFSASSPATAGVVRNSEVAHECCALHWQRLRPRGPRDPAPKWKRAEL